MPRPLFFLPSSASLGDPARSCAMTDHSLCARSERMLRVLAGFCLAAVVALGGCGYVETSPDSYRNPKVDPDAMGAQTGSLFGNDGLNILGGKKTDQGGGVGIGVNSYL